MNQSQEHEKIWHEPGDEDAWHCLCGNEPEDDGFYPCDETGEELEPVLGSGWEGLYVCGSCGRIIDPESLAVVGQRQASAASDR